MASIFYFPLDHFQILPKESCRTGSSITDHDLRFPLGRIKGMMNAISSAPVFLYSEINNRHLTGNFFSQPASYIVSRQKSGLVS